MVQSNPGNHHALYNLALTYYKAGNYQSAKEQLKKLLSIRSKHTAALIVLGLVYQAEEDFHHALIAFDKCLAIDAASVIALHNKSIILRHQKKYQEAVALAQAAIQLNPGIGDIHQNLGSCLVAMGKVDLAISSFESALKLEPLNSSHHHWLNQLLWKEGKNEFLNSYHSAIKSTPQAHHLRRELVYKLTLAGRLEEAEEHSSHLVKKDAANPLNFKLHGVVLRKQRRFSEAVNEHLRATKLDPENLLYQEELVTSYLGCGDSGTALPLVNKMVERDKNHQGYLALKSTALRIAGSDEYYDLCDYDKLVLRTTIEPPPGYSSVADFNGELASYLSDLHISKEHPLDQSLVNGTQTIDNLFESPHHLVKLLKDCFDVEMYRYLKQLPVDNLHPTLSRNSYKFSCMGAWSVLLHTSGFHQNHFHSHGWFSGPYYVALPDVVNDEQDKQGWIKFGEPGFDTIVPLPPDLLLKPEAGLMVRFPSFMWHGTIPFDSNQDRLVVTLDLDSK